MFKKVGTALCFTVLMLLLCAGAQAESYVKTVKFSSDPEAPWYDVFEDEGSEWYYYYEGDTITLYEYRGTATDIVLPAALNNHPVTDAYALAVPENTVSLTIPGSFTTISSAVRYKCQQSLESLTLLEGVETIGSQAFFGCTSLQSVTLPDSLRTIEQSAFYNCTSLEEVHFGSGLQEIGTMAFQFCNSLTDVDLPQSLTTIRQSAFYCGNDGALTEIDIPDSVTTLELHICNTTVTMIVGEGSPAHAAILTANLRNYRIRGEQDTPDVQEGTTVNERADAIIAAVITANMTDYEKALTLHDYLTQHAQYDMPALNGNTGDYPHAHIAEGVLLDGRGVCDSYAKAYKLLLDKVNIPCVVITSSTHAWNMVQLEGKWTHVDVTWDDPTSSAQGDNLEDDVRSGREGRVYFGLTDYAIYEVHSHQWNGHPHEALDFTLNYTYRHGGLQQRISSVEEEILTRLENGDRDFSFILPSFDENDSNDGLFERLTVQAVGADPFTLQTAEGIEVFDLTLQYNSENGLLTVHAAPQKETRQMGAYTVSKDDTFSFPGAVRLTIDGVASAVEGVVAFTGEGTAEITVETDTSFDVYTFQAQALNTVIITSGQVEESAFEGSGVQRVVLTSQVTAIGDSVFANTPGLCLVRCNGFTEIGSDAIPTGQNVLILAPENSPAAEYAEENGIAWLIVE